MHLKIKKINDLDTSKYEVCTDENEVIQPNWVLSVNSVLPDCTLRKLYYAMDESDIGKTIRDTGYEPENFLIPLGGRYLYKNDRRDLQILAKQLRGED